MGTFSHERRLCSTWESQTVSCVALIEKLKLKQKFVKKTQKTRVECDYIGSITFRYWKNEKRVLVSYCEKAYIVLEDNYLKRLNLQVINYLKHRNDVKLISNVQ